jgi:hypothetical protein
MKKPNKQIVFILEAFFISTFMGLLGIASALLSLDTGSIVLAYIFFLLFLALEFYRCFIL